MNVYFTNSADKIFYLDCNQHQQLESEVRVHTAFPAFPINMGFGNLNLMEA